MENERELTDLEQAEAELEECQNELSDMAKMLEAKEAELTQYIGWKLSAQLESARAEAAVAALAEMTQLHKDRQDDLSFEYARAETAEAALAECREQALDWSMAHDAALARAEAAEALLAERDTPCVWAPQLGDWAGDGYSTRCGVWYQANQIDAGLFCPNCGHRIEVQELAP